jgi:hypothetical protein
LNRQLRCPEHTIQRGVDGIHHVGAAAEKQHFLEAAVRDEVAQDERRRQRVRAAIPVVELPRVKQLDRRRRIL